MGLRFMNDVEAWDGARSSVAFAAADAGTEVPILCIVTEEALVAHFDACRHSVPDLVRAFRLNRDTIEAVASLTYDLKGRQGPVVLRSREFAGRVRHSVH
jgi:hypothetical protein